MLSPEVLIKLAAQGIELHLIQSSDKEHEIVVRRPSRGEYKRFRASQATPSDRADAVERIMFDCLVHPSRDDLNALLESRPALADVFGMKVLELAGMTGEAEAKKL